MCSGQFTHLLISNFNTKYVLQKMWIWQQNKPNNNNRIIAFKNPLELEIEFIFCAKKKRFRNKNENSRSAKSKYIYFYCTYLSEVLCVDIFSLLEYNVLFKYTWERKKTNVVTSKVKKHNVSTQSLIRRSFFAENFSCHTQKRTLETGWVKREIWNLHDQRLHFHLFFSRSGNEGVLCHPLSITADILV